MTDNMEDTGLPNPLKPLSEVEKSLTEQGFILDFFVKEGKLHATGSDRHYSPEEVKIVNFYRFEGLSNPEDMSITYVIETQGGEKGTLTDAYGTYADAETNEFVKQVEEIHKKLNTSRADENSQESFTQIS
jgi:hypothetical protein